MKRQLLVTASGEDRPGIVARISEVFVKHGANLEDSRMALLGGEFAAIILLSVPSDKQDQLEGALGDLQAEGIAVTTKETGPFDPHRFKGYVPFELEVNGADHEGIVHRVTNCLRESAINIQSMESGVVNAPETGTPLFCMRATVQVPPSISPSQLHSKLNAIADAESIEIEVHALPASKH